MSKEAVTATLKTRFKNPAARLVLLCLAEHHNGKTGKCCPSVSLIMEETGLSRATVFRALYWLRGIADPNDKEKRKPISAIQWIDWTKASDRNGRQTASDYKLTFLAPGSQIETGGGSHDETEGGSQIETEEGLTHETGEGLIGETPNTNRKKEPKERKAPFPPEGDVHSEATPSSERSATVTASRELEGVAQADLLGPDAPRARALKPSRKGRRDNSADDGASGYAEFRSRFGAALKAAGRNSSVQGVAAGRKSWVRLTPPQQQERLRALDGYRDNLKAHPFKNPQHISTFINSGFEDFAVPAETASVDDLKRKVQVIALDIAHGQPERIKSYGWSTFEDVAKQAPDLWALAKAKARDEFNVNPDLALAA